VSLTAVCILWIRVDGFIAWISRIRSGAVGWHFPSLARILCVLYVKQLKGNSIAVEKRAHLCNHVMIRRPYLALTTYCASWLCYSITMLHGSGLSLRIRRENVPFMPERLFGTNLYCIPVSPLTRILCMFCPYQRPQIAAAAV